VDALLGLTAVAVQHNAHLRTPKHGSSYRMDGSVADTTCYTQAVDRQKVKAKDEFHETARITANRYA